MFANAAPLFDRNRMVLFEETISAVRRPSGKSRPVKKPVKYSEIQEPLFLEYGFEVELDVSLAPDICRIAEKPEDFAIGDHPPDVFGAVEVFLEQGVRGQPGAAACCNAAELLACSDNMNRRRIVGFSGSVRNGKGQAVGLVGLRIEAELEAEEGEEWEHPGVTSNGGRGVGQSSKAIQTVLKDPPEGSGVGEDRSDLVCHVPARLEAEIGRFLAGKTSRNDLIENVQAEEATLDSNRRIGAHGLSIGR